MADKKRGISRVAASPQQVKQAYGTLSHIYAVVEGIFEKGIRRKGLELLSVGNGGTVLEIGFGTGYALTEIAAAVGDNGHAYGLDVTPQMIKIADKRLNEAGLKGRAILTEGDARKMPYPNGQFDAVFIADTLELFDTPDIPRVLAEIYRVIKKGGRLVVVSLSRQGREDTLFIRFYEWLHRLWPKYINCRTIYAAESVKDAGFKIVKIEPFKVVAIAPYEIVLATR
jgi:demethylmenaquinone methyltransferase/2-methoxy-6-polyprenyl-1,4-benzoquinol methylase